MERKLECSQTYAILGTYGRDIKLYFYVWVIDNLHTVFTSFLPEFIPQATTTRNNVYLPPFKCSFTCTFLRPLHIY